MKYLASLSIALSIFLSVSLPSIVNGKSVLLGPEVLAKSEANITIKHSKISKNRATELAIIHCGQFGLLATYSHTIKQFGLASISTWHCG